MNFSKIDIINLALGHLGRDPVNDLTTEGPQIALVANMYDVLKGKCLEDSDWIFATKAVRLSMLANPSDFPGYKYTFALPTNPNPLNPSEKRLSVRSIQTEKNGNVQQATANKDYKLTADTVYTNEDVPTFCIYIFDQIESRFSYSFVIYFSLAIAAMAAIPITQSQQKKEELLKEAEVAKSVAIQNDKIQSPPTIIQNDFTNTRYGRFIGTPTQFNSDF